jgi:hypothetical protein
MRGVAIVIIKNTYKLLVVAVLLAIMVVIASFWFLIDEKNEESMYFKYNVEVYAENYGNYTLYFPVPQNEDGSVSEMINYLKIIKGSCSYEIFESTYGKCLKINANSSFEINIEGGKLLSDKNTSIGKNDIYLHEVYLSMYNGTINRSTHQLPIWIYFESDLLNNLTVKIEYRYSHKVDPETGISIHIDLNSEVYNGWNLVNASMLVEYV